MAEGEDTFTFGDDKPGNDDDEQEVNRQEVNRQVTFEPPRSSTPYHDWGQYEMQPMQEQSGVPDTSYEETPLLGDAQAINQISWDALTSRFPRASAINLETSYSKTGRLQVKMYGTGKKSYPLFTKDAKTGLERLNPSLPKEIKNSLGESAEQIIEQDRDTIQEQRQRLTEAENQERQTNELVAEKKKKAQEVEKLRKNIERVNARIDGLHEEHGSDLEIQAEINRLNLLKKNYEKDLDSAKKDLATLEKEIKKKRKN